MRNLRVLDMAESTNDALRNEIVDAVLTVACPVLN